MHAEQNDRPEHEALLALSMISGIGAGKARQLVQAFGSAQDVMTASYRALREVNGIGEAVGRAIVDFNQSDAVQEQFLWAERANASFLPYWDDQFPDLLNQIYDPPAFLWARGDLSVLTRKSIAIVTVRSWRPY